MLYYSMCVRECKKYIPYLKSPLRGADDDKKEIDLCPNGYVLRIIVCLLLGFF